MSDSTAQLRIELDTRPLERVPSELAVAGVFLEDRPLRGAAGRADWRLCGLLTDLVVEEELNAELGEAVLIGSSGRLAAPALLVVGLGSRTSFDAACFEAATRTAIERVRSLAFERIAMAPLGVAGEDIVRLSRAFVEGVLAGLGSKALTLRLCVPETEERRIRAELVRCVRDASAEVGAPAPPSSETPVAPPQAAPR
ncbi:MAG: M17 family peptidase N-terminal domain-containing protein [Myxococcota bacterium]|nr:M17 family peptidase N-terminal domain-containing protein [Myxococcota bacterium]